MIYIASFGLKTLPKELKRLQERAQELNSYLTTCKLQPYHQFLALKTAMGACYKVISAFSLDRTVGNRPFGCSKRP